MTLELGQFPDLRRFLGRPNFIEWNDLGDQYSSFFDLARSQRIGVGVTRQDRYIRTIQIKLARQSLYPVEPGDTHHYRFMM